VAQPVVQADLPTGPHTEPGAQLEPQAGFLLHLKQSNRPFFGAVPHPLGAQLTGVVQAGLVTGPQTPLGPQLVAQEDFLHLKQSNRPFLGADVQPVGAQLTGAAQAGLAAGPQIPLGPQVVPQFEDFFPERQSNKPHFFLGCVAHATGGLQDFVVAHALPPCEPNRPAADTALANPSEATVARLMLRIHFIVPCLLPLGLFREPSDQSANVGTGGGMRRTI